MVSEHIESGATLHDISHKFLGPMTKEQVGKTLPFSRISVFLARSVLADSIVDDARSRVPAGAKNTGPLQGDTNANVWATRF